jgi:hypothetical protein
MLVLWLKNCTYIQKYVLKTMIYVEFYYARKGLGIK